MFLIFLILLCFFLIILNQNLDFVYIYIYFFLFIVILILLFLWLWYCWIVFLYCLLAQTLTGWFMSGKVPDCEAARTFYRNNSNIQEIGWYIRLFVFFMIFINCYEKFLWCCCILRQRIGQVWQLPRVCFLQVLLGWFTYFTP